MARVRHTVKAMEGDGSPSNQEEHPASPVVADVAAASSSSSSSSEFGKISGLDGSASSRESSSSTHLPRIAMQVVIQIATVMWK
jgi:hypothetical protein